MGSPVMGDHDENDRDVGRNGDRSRRDRATGADRELGFDPGVGATESGAGGGKSKYQKND